MDYLIYGLLVYIGFNGLYKIFYDWFSLFYYIWLKIKYTKK